MIAEKFNERWQSVETIFKDVTARAVEANMLFGLFEETKSRNIELERINKELYSENINLKAKIGA